MAFHAEKTVNPPVLVCRQSHVIHVDCRIVGIGHGDRMVVETEVVDAVGAFGDGKERLAVGTFHADNEHILAVPLDCARIKRGVHAYALHEVRVAHRVVVITPEWRSHACRNHRVLVAAVYAVVLYLFVRAAYQFLIFALYLVFSFFKD